MKLNFNPEPSVYTHVHTLSGKKAERVAKKIAEKAAIREAQKSLTSDNIAERKKIALELQDFRDNALGMRFFVSCAALQCTARVTYIYANSKSEKDALKAQFWGLFRGVGCLCPMHKEIQLKRMAFDLRSR